MITKSVKQNDKEIETFITHLDSWSSVWPVSKSGKSFSLISRIRLDSPSFKQLLHLKQEAVWSIFLSKQLRHIMFLHIMWSQVTMQF